MAFDNLIGKVPSNEDASTNAASNLDESEYQKLMNLPYTSKD